ncbi:unnamed protein product [Diabrotica balteata]|uniref:Uncharacterized protein n=1 Tax=Diabrotica balteata TaxID=107213 RepID=A0A9N9TFM3_DIABA|nr:unnamed protein product [Diabrotica balteata]
MPPNPKKSLFYYCFPCIKRPKQTSEEVLIKTFGHEFTEYEYVIENLAIRRAPKVILDQYQPAPKIKNNPQTKKPKVKDFAAVVAKPTTECDIVGPIVKMDKSGDSFDCCPRGGVKCSEKVKEDVLKKILIPPSHVYRVEHPTPRHQKVAADIHKNSDGAVLANRRLTIPHEIRETIDALKIARPLQSSPRRNRRHLVRSVSDTSCDKETCCNFLGADLAKFDNKDNRSSLVDVFSKPTKLKNVSKFPQHRKLSPEVNMMELTLYFIYFFVLICYDLVFSTTY